MADDADIAQDEIEFFQAIHLSRRHKVLLATGKCHYCDEDVDSSRLFCDNSDPKTGDRGCAADYEAEQEARARSGL